MNAALEDLFFDILFKILLPLFVFTLTSLLGKETANFSQDTNSTQQNEQQISSQPAKSQEALVSRVIDGDTIELENGQKVRYIGIDAPETKDPSVADECYGQEAFAKNKSLVEGKIVSLESDVNNTDRYGRLLRYVYVDEQMVNEILVRDGYAVSSPYPPDVKHQETLDQAEQEARENNQGLWGEQCQLENPE